MKNILAVAAALIALSSCALIVPTTIEDVAPAVTTTTVPPYQPTATTTAPAQSTPTTAVHVHPTTSTAVPIPLPAPGRPNGFGTVAVGVQIQVPSGDGTGNFRTFCSYSHMNYDDSIVHPGRPNASHLHTYFGNMSSDAMSTAASLLAAGDSSCEGGTLNRSSYWVPAVLTADGTPVVPNGNIVYYKSGYQGVDPSDAIVLPNGLKMLAGNPNATSPQSVGIARWFCSGDAHQATIPVCPAGSTLNGALDFPQCWDGINLDSPDHRSHMAYGTYGIGCPASHPVPLPSITFNISWPVTSGDTSGWRLSSDMGQAGGTTLHGDYIAAWDPSTVDAWLNNCTRRNADCGVSLVAPGIRLRSM